MITVGIVTRNRPDELLRNLASLRQLSGSIVEAIIVDDYSETPVDELLHRQLDSHYPISIRTARMRSPRMYIEGLNYIDDNARADFVLHLDDDAFVVDGQRVIQALEVAQLDSSIGAAGFAQCDECGRLHDISVQPSPHVQSVEINAFTGYGFILRRSAWQRIGGFNQLIYHFGWEKDLCIRLWDAGYKVVYSPEWSVGHLASTRGRDMSVYLRYTVRNDLLFTLLNLPVYLWPFWLPLKIAAYSKMRNAWGVNDPGGMKWVLAEVRSAWPEVRRKRRVVQTAVLSAWRRRGKTPIHYQILHTTAPMATKV